MSTKRRKLVLRYSSPSMMWFGLLFACFAWVMHVTPLLSPLWDDNASLGHGVCAELAPIVSIAQHYQHIQNEIAHAESNLPTDSAAHHLHHHVSPSASVKPIVALDEASPPTALPKKAKIDGSDPTALQHISCDLCIAMSAVLVPDVFTHTDPAQIELSALSAPFLYRSSLHYPSHFLRPLARAPPQATPT